jgi:hypothetical protein
LLLLLVTAFGKLSNAKSIPCFLTSVRVKRNRRWGCGKGHRSKEVCVTRAFKDNCFREAKNSNFRIQEKTFAWTRQLSFSSLNCLLKQYTIL